MSSFESRDCLSQAFVAADDRVATQTRSLRLTKDDNTEERGVRRSHYGRNS
ncbi:hypothetical protein PHYSODRAFT_286692 [Phytophthora sojae]|uniref:Uncharacterized protein n=2 Tax=Phytophthora sojae TaxID=67593 RepID=G4ZR97_PHYSP|nr:hypothetical protein PHYSODRAFT_286692 [Phytophthora sojae]EGZ13782.1 hypothetical protein PHYSODRAFT_286692 [Phytophthora sojae]|eukprot:XP_009531211.1 hypothetical protein PHYSODRAFT_286692 [Phytophthora sojae]